MKFWILTLTATLLVLSSSVNASVISVDYQLAGDNLITRDTTSGLDWLDLTETTSLSRLTILNMIGSGGELDGWRYASSSEVANIWGELGVDLTGLSAQRTSNFVDSNVLNAFSYFGNTLTNGAVGVTADPDLVDPNFHERMGAIIIGDTTRYDLHVPYADTSASSSTGHYLVQVSTVPVPAAIWLFGSGLIGLIGFAIRKKA